MKIDRKQLWIEYINWLELFVSEEKRTIAKGEFYGGNSPLTWKEWIDKQEYFEANWDEEHGCFKEELEAEK